MMTDALTNDERENLMAWIPLHRPACKTFPRPQPNVLYRVIATEAGTVYAQRMDEPRSIRRIAVRDEDDEPWGDPVGLGMPRPRLTLLGALWHVVTWKYRRVW